MNSTAASGYIVEASSFLKLFVGAELAELTRLLDDGLSEPVYEEITDWLNQYLPDTMPVIEHTFVLTDEDNSDSLQHGIIYCFIDEDELFIKTPSEYALALTKEKIVPTFNRWTVWG